MVTKAQLDKLGGRIEGLASLFDPDIPVRVAVFKNEAEHFAMQRHRELRPEHAGRRVQLDYRPDARDDLREMLAVWAGSTDDDMVAFRELIASIGTGWRRDFVGVH